jgi:hopanoid biosynthesis associated RND transporter like protein HpnN
MASKRAGDHFFRLCARIAVKAPWMVLLASLVLTVLAVYASLGIAINTGTEGIFSANVEFMRNVRAYERIFPNKGDPIVAVIDAPTADRAQTAADTLAEQLRDSSLFQRIEVPGSEAYFRRAGLLFLEAEQLQRLREQLHQARYALNMLSAQPNLFGVSRFIDLITAGVKVNYELPALAANFVQELADTVRLQAESRASALSWSSLFGIEGLQETGKRRFVLAYPVFDKTSVKRIAPALDAAQAAALAVSSDASAADVRIRLTGQPVLAQQELDAAFSGALAASALSFSLVALTLVLGIRSWRMILILIVTLVIGSVWTSGLAAVFVGELNLISLAFGVLFFAVGVDFGTHLGLRYLEKAAVATPEQAITRAVIGEGPAITLSVICASVGFLSFLPTEYLGLAQLGLISALGMVAAFAATLLLLPAILAVWPPAGAVRHRDASRYSTWMRRRAGAIIALAALGTLAATALATRARVDPNPLNLQDPNTEAVQVYRELARDPATSPYEVNLIAPDLRAARALAERLRRVDAVAEVRTVESFIPEDQEQKAAAVAAIVEQFERLATATGREGEARELGDGLASLRKSARSLAAESANLPSLGAAAEALAAALDDFAARRSSAAGALDELNRALAGGLPALFDELRQSAVSVTLADLPDAIRRDWLAPDGTVRVQATAAARATEGDELEAFAARVQAISPAATGIPIMIAEAANVVRQAFAQAVLITALAIIAIIAVVRRSLVDVVLTLIPLVLASVWTIATAALLGLTFNFANVIVIPVLLGVGVASAIHVLARAREMGQPHASRQLGFLDSSTPRAVLLTDANTALAFGTLAVSSHRGLFSMGLLLAIATTLSLIASLIVLPAALAWLGRGRPPRPLADADLEVPQSCRMAERPFLERAVSNANSTLI